MSIQLCLSYLEVNFHGESKSSFTIDEIKYHIILKNSASFAVSLLPRVVNRASLAPLLLSLKVFFVAFLHGQICASKPKADEI